MADAAIMTDSVRERLPALVARALISTADYGEEVGNRLRKIDAKTCRLVPMPYYSLTANVVLYAGEEPLQSLFNLETSVIRYFIYQGDGLVGLIFYKKNPEDYSLGTTVDEYEKVLKNLPHVTKFLIQPDIKIKENQVGAPFLGYISNGHIIINSWWFGLFDVKRTGRPNGLIKISERYEEEYYTKLIEVYYSTKGTTLRDKIAAAYKSVLKQSASN